VHFTIPVLAPTPADFAFSCNRCGNCCTNQSGHVWVEPDEIAAMAANRNIPLEAFSARFVRNVGGRLSLVEERGRCAMLGDRNECTVYDARPRQCRDFPFWPGVLAGGEEFERARGVCPGILEVPRRAARRAAYRDLEAFYAQADARIQALNPVCSLSGNCCNFPVAGHRLFATILEVDYAAEHGPAPATAEGAAERPDWCAFYHGGRCHARGARPLACRAYFCDPKTASALADLHEVLLAELRGLERAHGYPAGYGDFVELLEARRNAISLLDARRRDS
jgi:hypothetical protein